MAEHTTEEIEQAMHKVGITQFEIEKVIERLRAVENEAAYWKQMEVVAKKQTAYWKRKTELLEN